MENEFTEEINLLESRNIELVENTVPLNSLKTHAEPYQATSCLNSEISAVDQRNAVQIIRADSPHSEVKVELVNDTETIYCVEKGLIL